MPDTKIKIFEMIARINLYFDRIEMPVLLLTEKIQKRIDAKIKDRRSKTMSYTAEDLDRYITGNYGEDYFKGIEEDLECECGKVASWDCATCLNDYCEDCAESHILNHHEIGGIS